jgi:hypothetical protein
MMHEYREYCLGVLFWMSTLILLADYSPRRRRRKKYRVLRKDIEDDEAEEEDYLGLVISSSMEFFALFFKAPAKNGAFY